MTNDLVRRMMEHKAKIN